MLNELPAIIPVSGASLSVRPELSPTGGHSHSVKPKPLPSVDALQLGEAAGAKLERLAEEAAKQMFPGREVAVESFYDKNSGRYVHRIADSESGELLLQTPPDELLRFFASGREPYGAPLLEIDA